MGFAGKISSIVARLMVPMILAATLHAGPAPAQVLSMDQACTKAFAPLREETERRGRLIKAASERHAPPSEACKLIGDLANSETRMIEFIEANAEDCEIPPGIANQLKSGHQRTEVMRTKVCAIAQTPAPPAPTFGPRGPTGDFDKVR